MNGKRRMRPFGGRQMRLAAFSTVVLFVGAPIQKESRITPFPNGVEKEAPTPYSDNSDQQSIPRWRLDPDPEESPCATEAFR